MTIYTSFKIATSRYQERKLIVTSKLVPIRITVGPPRFRLGYELGGRAPNLYPDRSMLAIEDEKHFEDLYRAKLDALGAARLRSDLAALSENHGGAGLVLLCFEDVRVLGEFSCHRRSFARWWEERTGEVVPELTENGP